MQDASQSPKDRAVEAVGGVTRLSEKLGITRSAVSQWQEVPVERVLEVEKLTGVPRHELRPDIYPPQELDLASAADTLPTSPSHPKPAKAAS